MQCDGVVTRIIIYIWTLRSVNREIWVGSKGELTEGWGSSRERMGGERSRYGKRVVAGKKFYRGGEEHIQVARWLDRNGSCCKGIKTGVGLRGRAAL